MTTSAPPAAIRPASFAAPATATPLRRPRQRWLFALALLSVVAVAFVVAVLPRLVAPPAATSSASSAPPPATAPASRTHTAEPGTAGGEALADAAEAPPDDAARRASQARLDETLAALTALEARQAEHWARPRLHAIREQVAAGEKAYRERRYAAAGRAYSAALAGIAAVEADIPAITAALHDAGGLALTNGDSAAAAQAYEEILAITPDDDDARAGRARAATLDRVGALVEQGAGFERMGETDKALGAYRAALELDAQATAAASAVARIEQARRAARFRDAMSRGFAALEQHDFSGARDAFARAAALDQTSAEVADARTQVDAAETAWGIEQALQRARSAAAGEHWADAVTAYGRALQLDAGLAGIAVARDAARARARLDTALAGYLARPARLADAAVREEARSLLERTRAAAHEGPRLKRQLGELEHALALATTPLSVTLHSDTATEVRLNGIGELGRFDARALDLLPGDYVAVGRRDGFRDVRVEFSLRHDSAPPRVDIRCREALAPGS